MQSCSKGTSQHTGKSIRLYSYQSLGAPPPHELTSYCPISLLPIISKVFENFILKRLLPMVEKNQLIPNHQFGFRQRNSTIEQTHRIVQWINEALEHKQYCSAAFIDITQAFDKVWHTGLLYKLKLSLPSNYFLILKSCMQDRHFLNIENEYTELSTVSAGVNQRQCSWAITLSTVHCRSTRNYISNLCRRHSSNSHRQ
jgi:hypothetical protein